MDLLPKPLCEVGKSHTSSMPILNRPQSTSARSSLPDMDQLSSETSSFDQENTRSRHAEISRPNSGVPNGLIGSPFLSPLSGRRTVSPITRKANNCEAAIHPACMPLTRMVVNNEESPHLVLVTGAPNRTAVPAQCGALPRRVEPLDFGSLNSSGRVFSPIANHIPPSCVAMSARVGAHLPLFLQPRRNYSRFVQSGELSGESSNAGHPTLKKSCSVEALARTLPQSDQPSTVTMEDAYCTGGNRMFGNCPALSGRCSVVRR